MPGAATAAPGHAGAGALGTATAAPGVAAAATGAGAAVHEGKMPATKVCAPHVCTEHVFKDLPIIYNRCKHF